VGDFVRDKYLCVVQGITMPVSMDTGNVYLMYLDFVRDRYLIVFVDTTRNVLMDTGNVYLLGNVKDHLLYVLVEMWLVSMDNGNVNPYQHRKKAGSLML
jgi:hypothetical protein